MEESVCREEEDATVLRKSLSRRIRAPALTVCTPSQALSHSLQAKIFSLQLTVFNAFFTTSFEFRTADLLCGKRLHLSCSGDARMGQGYTIATYLMDANETITDVFTRFTNIINALKDLGKIYTTSENFRKILRSLPKTWEAKVMAIQEAKRSPKLPLEELIGSLMTHEIIIKKHLEDESKKKKSIALKTISLEVDLKDEDDLDEDDIAYFSQKYKNFIKGKNISRNTYQPKKSQKLKLFKKSKKKAMKATWDDSSESGDEVEKMAYLGLMAHKKLSSEYVVLKKKYNVLTSENKSLLHKHACFKENENVVQIEELNVSSDKHVCDCNEKDALLDKVRFLKHDGCEKDNLIKVLKENELNVLQDLNKAKETIEKLTINARRLDKIIGVGKSYGVIREV
ncbi:UBN2 domain-containing protein [Cucumis melo var. makuwa]|uniref:UBN2 domain-containing protein n=1 Tax=Cucumis melo var. makuwa TaxID=1194695 RepID=A0A5D3DLU8_CUCMM|nr:UBN2 domain-containing protein [Cucumis melo var. makuwa]